MSWELIVTIVGMVLPYVVWIERRMQNMSERIASKVSNEEVEKLIDLKQERVIERLDNTRADIKEDIKEIKDTLQQLLRKS